MRKVQVNFLDSWVGSRNKYILHIDGNNAGQIKFGQCFQYSLSEEEHLIQFVCHSEYGTSLVKESIVVPADKYHKKYNVKSTMSGFLISEDAELAAWNQKLYDEEQLAINQYKKEQRYLKQTSMIIKKVECSEIGKRDYSIVVKELTAEQRSILGYKNLMKGYVKDLMGKAVMSFPDKSLMCDYIHDLSTISECAKGMEPLLKYVSYIGNPEIRMKSIFNDEDEMRIQLDKLKQDMQEEFGNMGSSDIGAILYEKVQRYNSDLQQFKEYAAKKDSYKALRKITFADSQGDYEATLGQLPKYLFYDVFLDKREGDVLQLSMFIKNVYEQLFSCGNKDDKTGEITYYPTTDMLISDILMYSKGNFIENIEEKLKSYFEGLELEAKRHTVGGFSLFCSKQCEIVRKTLELYKAPNQEKKLLEYMYEFHIPRTENQERRLAFLKSGKQSNVKILEGSSDLEHFIYDYRMLGKKAIDVEKYLENFTMESKILKTPMVLEEWAKSVQKRGIQWKEKEICQWLERYLNENFGDRYHAEIIQSAPLNEVGNDLDNTILIRESKDGKYPFLGYLVTGEKMTLKQVDLSVYAIFLPNECTEDTDVILHNQKVIEWAYVLYDKQNPKINNNIELMKSVLIEGLEEWLNNSCIEADIYS